VAELPNKAAGSLWLFPTRERQVERGDAEGRGELDFNKYGFQLKAAARRRARGRGQAVAVVLK
jgi:hypothetical protein